jgi:7-cyano-7-deazaguanine reductase
VSNINELTQLGSQGTTYEVSSPNASQLETFPYLKYPELGARGQIVGFKTDEFTTKCPKTGQPDFASLDIAYIPRNLGVESKSLKLYLVRYREHGSFHEDCVNKIASDLIGVLDPLYLRVVGDFTKRGGIAIKPITEYVADGEEHPTEQLATYDRYAFERQ